MTTDASNVLIDGFGTLDRGMDSGRDPSLLPSNQASLLVNATVRGGFVSNRPGFRKLGLTFDPKPITSISRTGTLATVTTPLPHQLRDGDVVTVSGATDPLYNITAPITDVPSQSFAIDSIVGLQWPRIAILNSDGSLASGFFPGSGPNGVVRTIVIQPDGKILIGGDFNQYNGAAQGHIARINPDGSNDTAFRTAIGTAIGAFETIYAIALQSTGKIIVVGNFTSFNGTARGNIVRLNSNGTLDATFQNLMVGANNTIDCLAVQSDDNIVIGGSFSQFNGVAHGKIARISGVDGSLDGTFSAGANGPVGSVALTPTGKIVVGGLFSLVNGYSRNNVAMLNADSTLNAAFAPPSFSITTTTHIGNVATVTTPVAHGLAGGESIQFLGATGGDAALYNSIAVITRLSATTFSYVLGGVPAGNAVGTLSYYSSTTGFANGEVRTVLVQNAHIISIGGDFTSFNGTTKGRLVSVFYSGAIASSFDVGTGADAPVRALSVGQYGNLLVGGDFILLNTVSRKHIGGLLSNGTTSFAAGNGASNSVYSIAVQPNGKIIVGGLFLCIQCDNPKAIVTTHLPHGFSRFLSGQKVIVSGATGADAGIYNGEHEIVILGNSLFSYALASIPAANATGTLSYSLSVNKFTYVMAGTPASNAAGTLIYVSKTGFEDVLFQGACYYKPPNSKAQIALSIGGQLFLVTPGQFESYAGRVSNPLMPGGRNNSTLPQAWMLQAEIFLLVQDGQSSCLIWDGSTMKRSDSLGTGIPVGKQMAYGLGRLWVALGRNYVAGDIVMGPSGTRAYGFLDAILQFTENQFLKGGGTFQVPLQSGDITGMAFLANLDTSLGDAELLVLTNRNIFSVNVPLTRADWASLTNPIQRIAVNGYGALGFYSTLPVNADLFYRGYDGIRTVSYARREFGQWGNTPVSREMQRILSRDDKNMLEHSSAVAFDNRMLMTCSPVHSAGHGVYHRGLVALDFDLLSNMAGKAPPTYDGLWTGLNILQIVKGDFGGKERCFAVVLSPENKIEIWEVTKNDWVDRTAPGELVSIQWRVDASSLTFQSSNQQLQFQAGSLQAIHTSSGLKALVTADVFVKKLMGEVNFTLSYSPDELDAFVPWLSWHKCANILVGDADVDGATTIVERRPQYRSAMRMPQAPGTDNLIDLNPVRYGYKFQPRLDISGAATLYTFRLSATSQEEDPLCEPTDSPCQTLLSTDTPLFNYSSYGN